MLATGLGLVLLTYLLVLAHQAPVLRFFGGGSTSHRVSAVALLAVTVPLFAYVYGSCIGLVAKLLRFD